MLHRVREVLVAEAGLGVPAPAVVASDGMLGGTRFEADALRSFDTWQQAQDWAGGEARRLGYALDWHTPSLDRELDAEEPG